MKKKKPINEKPNVSIPGLRIRCKKCNTWVSKCAETGADLKECPHKEQLTYLAVIHLPGTKHGRVVRELGSDLSTAVTKLAALKEQVRHGNVPKQKGKSQVHNPPVLRQLSPVVVSPVAENQITLVTAMSKYISFLNNVDTPKHLHRERSKHYKDDITRAFKYFCGCLKKAGYAVDSYPLSSLSDTEVGFFYQYLIDEKNSSPFTYNRYLTYFTSFLAWAQKKGYSVKNVFEDVPRLDTEPDSKSISRENYEQMLSLVTHENGFQHFPGKKKEARNVYRDFLVTGYRIGLMTGRRTEEVISLRFSDIDDEAMTIRVEDFKPNRILNRQGAKKKFIYVPITKQLRTLIDTLGYEEHKGTDRHLLAPEIVTNRVANISDALSRSFSHYYKQLNTGEVLTWKSLRKTYLTRLKIFLQQGSSKIDVKDISNHSGDAVLDKHYFDKRLIAAALAESGFEVFPSWEEELVRVRSLSKQKSNEKEIGL